LVLAVLCDFGGREPQEVVNYIVRRLSELTGTDEKRFREYMTMLEILSENRNLRPQIEEAERMLTQIDIERMPSYVIGLERGERLGERLGLELGRAVEKRHIVRRLLTRMDVAEVAGLLGLSADDVTRIAAEDDATGSG
jgi:predicted transposase YdaD